MITKAIQTSHIFFYNHISDNLEILSKKRNEKHSVNSLGFFKQH